MQFDYSVAGIQGIGYPFTGNLLVQVVVGHRCSAHIESHPGARAWLKQCVQLERFAGRPGHHVHTAGKRLGWPDVRAGAKLSNFAHGIGIHQRTAADGY